MNPTDLFNWIPKFLDPGRQPTRIEGWCTVAKACDLAAAVFALRPSVAVEIGIFGGSSLIPIAMAMRVNAYGQVIGIDPWSAVESAKGQTGANLEWWSALDHEAIYRGFMEAVNSEGVANQTVALRQTSDQSKPPDVIDLLHVDGNHGEQAFRDIERFAPNVRVGGLCYLDDIGWDGGAVGRGAEWVLKNGFAKLYDRDGGAMFQRVKPMRLARRGRPPKAEKKK